jgi:hypothetical protein
MVPFFRHSQRKFEQKKLKYKRDDETFKNIKVDKENYLKL